MRLSLCSARLWEYFTGLRRSYDAGWAAVWWNLPFGSPWADFECRYAYRYIQISAPLDHPWKYPSTLLPTFFRKCSWFSEKFTVCSWRFSLLHSFNTGFLLMMTVNLEGGFLENGIAFWGKVWYDLEVGVSTRLARVNRNFTVSKECVKLYDCIISDLLNFYNHLYLPAIYGIIFWNLERGGKMINFSCK